MSYTDFNWIDSRIAIGAFVTEPEELPFDAVLSMETHAPLTLRDLALSDRVDYQWRSIVDGVCEESNDAIVARFDDAAAQINAWLGDDARVLVHCMAGVSRSVTAVIWYYLRYRGLSWDEALERIRKQRVQANPNVRFEIPLRIEAGEPIDRAWIEQRITQWVEFCRVNVGVDVDPDEIRETLERQGTIALVRTAA